MTYKIIWNRNLKGVKSRGALISPDSNMRLTSPWARKIPTWSTDWSCNKTRHQQVKHREISSDLDLTSITSVSINPTNSRGPMPESGSAAQTCHSVLLTWVVNHTGSANLLRSIPLGATSVWSCFCMYRNLRQNSSKTQQTTECKQLLPETPCKRHVQIVRSWAEILHFLAWRIEEISMWIWKDRYRYTTLGSRRC